MDSGVTGVTGFIGATSAAGTQPQQTQGGQNQDQPQTPQTPQEEQQEQEPWWSRLFTMSLRVRISLIFSGALVFLAALAWRDAIDGFIATCCPTRNTNTLKFIWALILTFFVILFLHFLDQVILRISEADKRGVTV